MDHQVNRVSHAGCVMQIVGKNACKLARIVIISQSINYTI